MVLENVVGFVPARGGSSRLYRKNLRTVGGTPLVARTVRCLRAAGIEQVVVSTNDPEIGAVAGLHGAAIDWRDAGLADTGTTIEAVVREWIDRAEPDPDTLVIVAQPTSPLLRPTSVADAIDKIAAEGRGSVLSVTPERHLLWSTNAAPLYSTRRNSTEGGEPDYYRETGGVVAAHVRDIVISAEWPPRPVQMMIIDAIDAIDVDEYQDLVRARAGAKAALIEIRYAAGTHIGSGHQHRAFTLAAELSHHDVQVVACTEPVTRRMAPDVVILDKLDTVPAEIRELRDAGVRYVVSLEDLGGGTAECDVVVNELYEPGALEYRRAQAIVRSGPRWAVLRPEFQGHPYRGVRVAPSTVVVSFGGYDPSGLTATTLHALTGPEVRRPLHLRIVVPPRKPDWVLPVPVNSLPKGVTVDIVGQPVMGREFLDADLAVMSAGRTVHEAAACSCPVIAIAANEREARHSVCPGVQYLGHYATLDSRRLVMVVNEALANADGREVCAAVAYRAVDGRGAQRIAWLIDGLLAGNL